ncbi:MAG: hypothetical protein QGG25_04720 [Phycisphaerae bacterium]|jgi:hypothetical protein|nr:hypothetical protein [Phycisphaerae bacterium]
MTPRIIAAVLLSTAAVLCGGCDKPDPSDPTGQKPTGSADGTVTLAPGFYAVGKPEMDQVFELEKKADRVILCNDSREFDIGLGPKKDEVVRPIYLKFDQIEQYLKREKHKDIVVVWFDKSVMQHKNDLVSQRAAEVTGLLKKVGYRRVIILGAHSQGVHYLSDSKLPKS